MARRIAKGLSYYVLFWVAPMLAVVLAPILLHAASLDLSESTDGAMFAVAALLLAIVSLSVLGCLVDEACLCHRSFPFVLLAVQMVMLFGGMFLGSIANSSQAMSSQALTRFLSRGPLLTQQHAKQVSVVPAPRKPAISVEGLHQTSGETRTNAVESGSSISDARGTAAAMVAKPVAAASEDVPADHRHASAGKVGPGWTDAGDGYCQESGSGQEFSSLHAGGKTLKECQDAAVTDPQSLAIDFTEGDGGCDIRYPAGTLAKNPGGFSWWGWGGGRAHPAGMGKQKHDMPTRCYAKHVAPTAAVPVRTLAPTRIPSAAETNELIARGKNRFSIVLACASEGAFMVKTVKSFCERTPDDSLQEIIVVDDGTEPPLELMLGDIEPRCRLKVLRHRETLGLMIAKQTGGDAATGEFIGFFDCHVAPNKMWHKELMDVLKAGPRRMAVPTITDLDIDIWDERQGSQANSKCYIDFNAQFMWFDDDSNYIPVISGGLLAITRAWWIESGGYDSKMRGWGGENVDQSLRVWLCGGEIIRAPSCRVAHMWRIPSDSRTSAHYRHVTGSVDNIARVAASWFDKFKGKYSNGMLARNPPDVSNVMAVAKRLQCKPYTHFLHRFRKLYREGGLLPSSVFKLRSLKTGDCIQRQGQKFSTWACPEASWLHFANQNPANKSNCCSGIRAWNAMECWDRLDHEGVFPYYCDVTGKNDNQHYTLDADGRIRHPYSGKCVSLGAGRVGLAADSCETAEKWERVEAFFPSETEIYENEVKRLGLTESMPDN